MPERMLDIAKRIDEFFMGTSPIHQAMQRITKAMGELQIQFAIAGAMAANAHGHRRTTSDVDILIRREDLARFKDRYLGLGWVEKFPESKNFRDALCNVNIDVLIAGAYPGDGLPKPVAFPEPESVAEVSPEGIPYISLKALLELKIASGITAPHRMQDLADVMQLIRANRLPRVFADSLNPYVAEKFSELWQMAQVEDDY